MVENLKIHTFYPYFSPFLINLLSFGWWSTHIKVRLMVVLFINIPPNIPVEFLLTFSITVSTRAWQVVDLDFGGSTRTTHNLTLTNSTGTTVYFSLTNNRPETYEGAPAGLWSALETSQIACSVNNAGTYSAGMITVEGDNFKVFYGNSEEVLMTQAEIAITDNMV